MQTTKVQYITIDSNNVGDTKNVFTIDLLSKTDDGGSTTAVDINNVIGFKIVDAFFGGIGSSGSEGDSPDYIDITCQDIPPAAQISIVNSKYSAGLIPTVPVPAVLARIPLERSLSGSSSLIIYDKQWKPWPRVQSYFNPLNLHKFNFKIYERLSNGTYQLMSFPTAALPPTAARSFYFTIELTSLVRG
tara:strand:+ start:598 stop:1164 length:567 start_codon:yes stop_codon:yes gene_type:complete